MHRSIELVVERLLLGFQVDFWVGSTSLSTFEGNFNAYFLSEQFWGSAKFKYDFLSRVNVLFFVRSFSDKTLRRQSLSDHRILNQTAIVTNKFCPKTMTLTLLKVIFYFGVKQSMVVTKSSERNWTQNQKIANWHWCDFWLDKSKLPGSLVMAWKINESLHCFPRCYYHKCRKPKLLTSLITNHSN